MFNIIEKDPVHNLARDLLKVIKKGNNSLPVEKNIYLRSKDIRELKKELLFLRDEESGTFNIEIWMHHLTLGKFIINRSFTLDFFNDVIKKDPKGFCENVVSVFETSVLQQLIGRYCYSKVHLGRLYQGKPSKSYVKNFFKFISRLRDEDHLLVFNRNTWAYLTLIKQPNGEYCFIPSLKHDKNGLSLNVFRDAHNEFQYLISPYVDDNEIAWISKQDFLNIPKLPINEINNNPKD
jgi:hypothetical protein